MDITCSPELDPNTRILGIDTWEYGGDPSKPELLVTAMEGGGFGYGNVVFLHDVSIQTSPTGVDLTWGQTPYRFSLPPGEFSPSSHKWWVSATVGDLNGNGIPEVAFLQGMDKTVGMGEQSPREIWIASDVLPRTEEGGYPYPDSRHYDKLYTATTPFDIQGDAFRFMDYDGVGGANDLEICGPYQTDPSGKYKVVRDLENSNLPIILSSCSNPNLWGFLYEDFNPYPQCRLDGNGQSHFAISWACAMAVTAAGNG